MGLKYQMDLSPWQDLLATPEGELLNPRQTPSLLEGGQDSRIACGAQNAQYRTYIRTYWTVLYIRTYVHTGQCCTYIHTYIHTGQYCTYIHTYIQDSTAHTYVHMDIQDSTVYTYTGQHCTYTYFMMYVFRIVVYILWKLVTIKSLRGRPHNR